MSEIPYMMENTPEEFERVRKLPHPELKTADEWSEIKGFIIRDPDGWREEGAPPWHYRITEEEFNLRAGSSTIQLRRNDVY